MLWVKIPQRLWCMEKIKIRISSLVDGTPWLFTGEGTKTQLNSKTILDATEYIEGEQVAHHIEISQKKVKVSRFFTGATHLEFFENKKGNVFISTEYGSFEGKTITKAYSVKIKETAGVVSLEYNTDFDEKNANVKKIQISYRDI